MTLSLTYHSEATNNCAASYKVALRRGSVGRAFKSLSVSRELEPHQRLSIFSFSNHFLVLTSSKNGFELDLNEQTMLD